MTALTLNLLLASLLGLPSSAASKVYGEPEAYKVYSDLIPGTEPFQVSKPLLIEGQTIPQALDCVSRSNDKETAVRLAIENFRKNNRSRWRLTPSFVIPKQYEIVEAKEFQKDGWIRESSPWKQRFTPKPFPGFLEFSAIGFDPAKTVAVVAVTFNCGAMCGGGDLMLVHKVDGHWEQPRILCFWKR